MNKRTKITLAIVGASFALHFAAWSFVGSIKGERKREIVAISLAETKKKKEEKKEPPKPPDPKPEKAKVAPRVEPKTPEPVVEKAPPPIEAKASSMNAYADLGLGSMGGGTGGGIPIAGGGGGSGVGPTPTAPTATQRHVALAPTGDDAGELVKPKLERQIQPAYTLEARQANIEGFVQLELTVDASGNVVNVKVLKGLGYGLDEAAMNAARQYKFAPATRGGKPVPMTIKGKVRFALS